MDEYDVMIDDDEFDDLINGRLGFINDGTCDYGLYDGDSDDDEYAQYAECSEMSPAGTVSKDATILDDEKKKLDLSGNSVGSHLILHHHSGEENMAMDIKYGASEENMAMDIKYGASAENMATERQTKEKRKSREDGVESEHNDGTKIAIEMKKKKDSISESFI